MIVSLPPPNTGICQLLPHSVKMSQCSDIKRARKVVFMSRVAVRMPADSQEATDLCTRKLSFPLAATSTFLEIDSAVCRRAWTGSQFSVRFHAHYKVANKVFTSCLELTDTYGQLSLASVSSWLLLPRASCICSRALKHNP